MQWTMSWQFPTQIHLITPYLLVATQKWHHDPTRNLKALFLCSVAQRQHQGDISVADHMKCNTMA